MGEKRFAGKGVIVTGGASGIGKATARRFLEEGAIPNPHPCCRNDNQACRGVLPPPPTSSLNTKKNYVPRTGFSPQVVFTRVLHLGGSGRFGEGTARCLTRSEVVSEIGLAGRNEGALRRRVSEVGDKAHSVLVDICDERRLASVAADYDIVVNAAGPEWEVLLPALRAAIDSRTHYCDLGADGWTAEK